MFYGGQVSKITLVVLFQFCSFEVLLHAESKRAATSTSHSSADKAPRTLGKHPRVPVSLPRGSGATTRGRGSGVLGAQVIFAFSCQMGGVNQGLNQGCV